MCREGLEVDGVPSSIIFKMFVFYSKSADKVPGRGIVTGKPL